MAGFTGFRGYDPIADLRQAHGAIYWVLGAHDRSIPAVQSALLARSLIAEIHRTSWRVDVLPTGDHSLSDSESGRALDFFRPVLEWLDPLIR